MIDNQVIIGHRIARYRKNAKLTQEQLAEMMDISSNEISNLECAKNRLSYKTLVGLCNALNICPCQLLMGAIYDNVDDNIINIIRHLDKDEKEMLYNLLLTFSETKGNLKK